MNKPLLIALLFTISIQYTVLLRSDLSTTIITYPLNHQTQVSYSRADWSDQGAIWIYKNKNDQDYQFEGQEDRVTYYAEFWADCQREAILWISADETFSASVNGGTVLKGNEKGQIYKFSIKNLKCGLNKLTVNIFITDVQSLAPLIFAITQDQSKCYQCAPPLSYYNRDACKCECFIGCNCSSANKLYVWNGYPTCGCKCKQINFCAANKYFNARTCSCHCKKIACLPGYVQNTSNCLCQKRT